MTLKKTWDTQARKQANILSLKFMLNQSNFSWHFILSMKVALFFPHEMPVQIPQ